MPRLLQPIDGAIASGWKARFISHRQTISFGALHALNTALNMAFTLTQLLVLARLLPLDRYSQIVFIASIGFYLQPIDQALGRTNFLVLHDAAGDITRTGQRLIRANGLQFGLMTALSIAVGVLMAPTAAIAIENILFLFISLTTNFWAFELQAMAWAWGCRLQFVCLALIHRSLHFVALALGASIGSLLVFVGLAAFATVCAISVSLWLFRNIIKRDGSGLREASQVGLLHTFGNALLTSATDLLVLNAPYALIAARFGVGTPIIIFDSVMKVARIVMAAARTAAEIVLPHYVSGLKDGRSQAAHRLLGGLMLAFSVAALAAGTLVYVGGVRLFDLLLGANNVVTPESIFPAAIIVGASAIYQGSLFFLGFSNDGGTMRRLTGAALIVMAILAVTLWQFPPVMFLPVFAAGLCAIATFASAQIVRLFRRNRSIE